MISLYCLWTFVKKITSRTLLCGTDRLFWSRLSTIYNCHRGPLKEGRVGVVTETYGSRDGGVRIREETHTPFNTLTPGLTTSTRVVVTLLDGRFPFFTFSSYGRIRKGVYISDKVRTFWIFFFLRGNKVYWTVKP